MPGRARGWEPGQAETGPLFALTALARAGEARGCPAGGWALDRLSKCLAVPACPSTGRREASLTGPSPGQVASLTLSVLIGTVPAGTEGQVLRGDSLCDLGSSLVALSKAMLPLCSPSPRFSLPGPSVLAQGARYPTCSFRASPPTPPWALCSPGRLWLRPWVPVSPELLDASSLGWNQLCLCVLSPISLLLTFLSLWAPFSFSISAQFPAAPHPSLRHLSAFSREEDLSHPPAHTFIPQPFPVPAGPSREWGSGNMPRGLSDVRLGGRIMGPSLVLRQMNQVQQQQ